MSAIDWNLHYEREWLKNRGKIKGTMNDDVNKYFEIILAELFTS